MRDCYYLGHNIKQSNIQDPSIVPQQIKHICYYVLHLGPDILTNSGEKPNMHITPCAPQCLYVTCIHQHEPVAVDLIWAINHHQPSINMVHTETSRISTDLHAICCKQRMLPSRHLPLHLECWKTYVWSLDNLFQHLITALLMLNQSFSVWSLKTCQITPSQPMWITCHLHTNTSFLAQHWCY